jgi:hypothetical protein
VPTANVKRLKDPTAKDFRKWYENAKKPPTPSAPAVWYTNRGFQFEKALKFLLRSEGLSPRTSFRPTGEQVDGSFECMNRYFLLEAKWQKQPIPASDLFTFRGKVEGKLLGTIGVFISISGYSHDAADALIKGKTLSVIMFDEKDMDASMDPKIGFKRVLIKKLRTASEEGVPYWAFSKTIVTGKKII